MSALELVPVSFEQACAFVDAHHRHHASPIGHKFSTGVALAGVLVGVAIVGRPVSRFLDDGRTLEVTRVATDGTEHACSLLYAAAWRAAKALGYSRLITYTQEGESGSSLRGAGFRVVAQRAARGNGSPGWDRPSRGREVRPELNLPRTLWEASS